MSELIQRERHMPLAALAWNETDARAAIDEIARDAISHFHPETLWPVHPQDGTFPPIAGLYLGASGVIWALDYLHRVGATTVSKDFSGLFPKLIELDAIWLKPMPLGAHASLLMGDVGPMLVLMRLMPNTAMADRIYERVCANNELPLVELMWGTAGSMLACSAMHELTGEDRFTELYRLQAARLLNGLEEHNGLRIWLQDIYGQKSRFLGLVHGFAGNITALLRGWRWLSPEQQQMVASVSMRTLSANASRSELGVNWPTDADKPNEDFLCQVCHGAPGIVAVFADAPFSSPDFDQLLISGGELTWNAGPLTKGSNLCHGTGGNGYAFLKLFRRTGETKWLERARAFAMSAIEQNARCPTRARPGAVFVVDR